jgi:hypothetical protein
MPLFYGLGTTPAVDADGNVVSSPTAAPGSDPNGVTTEPSVSTPEPTAAIESTPQGVQQTPNGPIIAPQKPLLDRMSDQLGVSKNTILGAGALLLALVALK